MIMKRTLLAILLCWLPVTLMKGSTSLDQDVEAVLNHSNLIEQLYTIGAIRLENCSLHDGSIAPIFIDMQSIISYPAVLEHVVQAMWQRVGHLQFDLICGIPYNSLLLTIGLALSYKKPMIIPNVDRVVINQDIIGSYVPGNNVLVVEDVLASGECCIETVNLLREQGLKVKHVVAFIDRDIGAKQRLEAMGIQVHVVFTLHDLLNNVPCKID